LTRTSWWGFTGKRGNAWHWRQGTDNHYPDAIPVEDVRRRLFGWEPVKVEGTGLFTGEYVFARSDRDQATPEAKVCGTTGTYQAHPYSEWLIQNVSNLLDDDVQIGSAGLLKNGAIAWVQIELSQEYQAEGMAFRPTILATTSLNGRLPSMYKPVNTIVVCDNTWAGAVNEKGDSYRVSHTKNSKFVVQEARERTGVLLAKQAEAATQEISGLAHQTVTDKQFQAFLDVVNAIPESEGRSKTMATNKRDKLNQLWTADPRVAIWKNTVLGVYQLMNTFESHERIFRGNAAESAMMSTVTGKAFEQDAATLSTIQKVLQNV
jgi:phage/plasmid-like protein (TIGR03299 family)